MATPLPIPNNLSGLASRLVRDGMFTAQDAHKHQAAATSASLPFVTWLVENRKVPSDVVARAVSEEFGLPLFDINAFDPEQSQAKLVSEKLLRKHRVLPLYKRGTKLFVAITDPTQISVLDEIRFQTTLGIQAVIVEEAKLAPLLNKTLDAQDTTLSDLAGATDLDGLEFANEDDNRNKTADQESDLNDAPIVKYVNKLLLDAINSGASDIHIEPYEKSCRVRYRRDGNLYEVNAPPLALANRIVARVKILSRLDIAERRVPQDGRMKLKVTKTRAIDFRVSTLPTLWGEKVVMRILDPTSVTLGVDRLGFELEQKNVFLEEIARPYGMVLVTGPTGSGKTVTLYTAVNILNTADVNISTAEDPVEINLSGVNQVQIHEKAGLTFAGALRAFLRQDPDIVLVGEIRDLETAEIAIKAAQTGHMVLSTLHTNDAPTTLTRLVNMGVAPFNIASAVNLIIAQRLARRLCEHCKAPIDVPEPALLKAGFREEEIDGLTLFGPTGCDQCRDGYKGRVGLYQVMRVSEEIGSIIMRGGNALDIEKQACSEGVPNLREAGLRKVRSGVTSLAEVESVTNL